MHVADPGELDARDVEVELGAGAQIDAPAPAPVADAIGIAGRLRHVEQPRVAKQVQPVAQRQRRVDFAEPRSRVEPDIVRRVVQLPAQPVGGDAAVGLGVVVLAADGVL